MEYKNFDLFGNEVIKDPLLRDKFIEPPFTVLDTKRGEWQNRKRVWKSIGMRSEIGRELDTNPEFGGELDKNGLNKYGRKPMITTSIFDPALTELMYSWFCPKNGTILDPFAGGSVRGIVANYLGYNYTGIELREEQVLSNRDQAFDIIPDNQPKWIIGDSNKILDTINDKFDFIFSCPPYANLEVYSDLPDDISNMSYDKFMLIYQEIIFKSCEKLKPGSYACFVVGEVRDKKGNYIGFVKDTINAFIESNVQFYNDVILLQPLGTAMLRAAKIFDAGKKLTKVHENILIFKKP